MDGFKSGRGTGRESGSKGRSLVVAMGDPGRWQVGRIHETQLDRVLAPLSIDPRDRDEFVIGGRRFAGVIDANSRALGGNSWRETDWNTGNWDTGNWNTGNWDTHGWADAANQSLGDGRMGECDLAIQFDARVIAVLDPRLLVARHGFVSGVSRDSDRAFPGEQIPYTIPPQWRVLTGQAGRESWEQAWSLSGRANRIDSSSGPHELPYRKLLFDSMLAFCLDEVARWLTPGSLDGDHWHPSDDWFWLELPHRQRDAVRIEDFLAELHARWLVRRDPRLAGQSPRDVYRRDLVWIGRDLWDRQCQWSIQGECPPTLPHDTYAYRWAGFGPHEVILNFHWFRDLLRFTLATMWMRPDRSRDSMERWLHDRAETWLTATQPEIGLDVTPAQLLAWERERRPWVKPEENGDRTGEKSQRVRAAASGPVFCHLLADSLDPEPVFDPLEPLLDDRPTNGEVTARATWDERPPTLQFAEWTDRKLSSGLIPRRHTAPRRDQQGFETRLHFSRRCRTARTRATPTWQRRQLLRRRPSPRSGEDVRRDWTMRPDWLAVRRSRFMRRRARLQTRLRAPGCHPTSPPRCDLGSTTCRFGSSRRRGAFRQASCRFQQWEAWPWPALVLHLLGLIDKLADELGGTQGPLRQAVQLIQVADQQSSPERLSQAAGAIHRWIAVRTLDCRLDLSRYYEVSSLLVAIGHRLRASH